MGRLADSDLLPATDFLRQEHRRLRYLIAAARREPSGGRAAETLRKLRTVLHVHLALEEELFYPAVKQEPSREAEASLGGLLEGHLDLQLLLEDLVGEPSRGRLSGGLLDRLQRAFDLHIHDCERGLFDEAHLLSSDRLAELGAEMKERSDRILRPATGE